MEATCKRLEKAGKPIAFLALAALGLSLFPLLYLGFFAAPAIEDYIFGIPVHDTIEAGKGFFSVLDAIWQNIAYNYVDWQGTYTSVALFSVQPAAFSENAYFLTAFVFLGAVVASVFLALGAVRKIHRAGLLFLGSVLSFFAVQYLPSPAQGFYWWNGSVHYIFFWFLSVLAFTLQIRLSRKQEGKSFFALWIFCCLLGLLIGGGNYCTALVFPLLSCCLAVFAFLEKRPRRVLAANVSMALCGFLGLGISAAAPGNAMRQANFQKLGPLTAVGFSFGCSWQDLLSLLDWKILGALALCIPVFLYAVENSGYRFRWPFLILAGSYCAYAALYTPILFSLGGTELPPRVTNLMFLAGLFFLFGNAFYLAGWVVRRFELVEKSRVQPVLCAVFAGGILLFAVSVLAQFRTTNAYQAYVDLKSPELVTFLQEREDRLRIAEDMTLTEPRWQPLSKPPKSFYQARVTTWRPDVLLDGKPVQLELYRGRDGNVTFIELSYGLRYFQTGDSLTPSDFSCSFHVRGGEYVPLREFCNLLGFEIQYLLQEDTILLTSP